jgi:hypothetical protein
MIHQITLPPIALRKVDVRQSFAEKRMEKLRRE